MESTEAKRDPVDVLAEQFAERHRRGEDVSIDEYVAAHPSLANRIRETFPAIILLERLKPTAAELASTGAAGPSLDPGIDGLGAVQLGDYRMLREVGRGGMGVVYEAEQVSLGRQVAIKVFGRQWAKNGTLRRRFDVEARAAARLHHTNIVPVFGVGEDEGVCYYVMQYIRGQDLDVVLRELRRMRSGDQPDETGSTQAAARSATPHDIARHILSGHVCEPTGDSTTLPPIVPSPQVADLAQDAGPMDFGPTYWRSVAGIGLQAASALQYAHDAGILHRDIKPSNLMLDMNGRVWVTDFGLAKLDGQPDLTRDKDVVGTLRYIAPERLKGRCDTRSDTYGLGLVLYEVLTLQPAYPAADRPELIQQIAHGTPPAPRLLNPHVPADLETVILKAMSHEPSQRYASAADLGDDLRRFLEDQPIRARRCGRIERTWRWCRRNPMSACLAASVVALLFALTIGSFVTAARFHSVAEQRAEAIVAIDEARRDVEGALAELYPTNAIAAGRRGNDAEASLWFANAAALAPIGSDRALLNAQRAKFWSRNSATPVAALETRAGGISSMRFHPNGQFLIVQHRDDKVGVTIWDLAHERLLVLPKEIATPIAAAWSADGGRLAIASASGDAVVLEFPELNRVEMITTAKPSAPVELLQFSPDGQRLALGGGGAVQIGNVGADGPPISVDLPTRSRLVTLTFSPAGEDFQIGTADGRAMVCHIDGNSARIVVPAVAHQYGDRAAVEPVLADEGRLLLTIGAGELVWRRTDDGEIVRSAPLDGRAMWLVSDANGDRVAIASGQRAKVFDSRSGKLLASIPLPAKRRSVGAMSPDGMMLLIAGQGEPAGLWFLGDGARLKFELQRFDDVDAASFCPAGRFIAAHTANGLIRVWKLPAGALPAFRVPVAGRFASARFDRSGRYVMASGVCVPFGSLRTTQVYDAERSAPAGPVLAPIGQLRDVDFSPDGRTLVAANVDAESGSFLQCWDWQRGTFVGPAVTLPSEPRGVRYAPDGMRIAVRCAGGQVLLLDSATSEVVRSWNAPPLDSSSQWILRGGGLGWSPDGQSLVTWGSNAIQVWDPQAAALRYSELKHDAACSDARFSASGKLLVTAGLDRTVRVWDFATGLPAAAPLVPDSATALRFPSSYSATFLRDDGLLLVSGADGRVGLWDWRSNRLVQPLANEADATAVCADGRFALTGSADRGVRLWDLANQTQAAPIIPTSGVPMAIEVASGDRFAAVSGSGAALDVLRLDELSARSQFDPARALAWSELVAGQRLWRGRLRKLSSAEWLARWRACRGDRSVVAPAPAEAADWHRQQAALAGEASNLAAEQFHLLHLVAGGTAHWSEWSRSAEVHARLRQWRQAADMLAGALLLNTDDAQLHVRQGDILIAAGDDNRAAEAFGRAIGLQGQRGWVRGNWWTIGPYAGGLSEPHAPETQSNVSRPVVDDSAAGDAEALSWNLQENTGPLVEFHNQFNWAENVVGYAQTIIYSETEQQVSLSLGADDALCLWLNGQVVFTRGEFFAPQSASVVVNLKQGKNHLLAKVANQSRHHSFYLEISDQHTHVPPSVPAAQ